MISNLPSRADRSFKGTPAADYDMAIVRLDRGIWELRIFCFSDNFLDVDGLELRSDGTFAEKLLAMNGPVYSPQILRFVCNSPGSVSITTNRALSGNVAASLIATEIVDIPC